MNRSLLSEITARLTRAGFKSYIRTGRSRRPGYAARAMAPRAVFVLDHFGADRDAFGKVCAELAAAGYILTDCTPAMGADYVRLGCVRVMPAKTVSEAV